MNQLPHHDSKKKDIRISCNGKVRERKNKKTPPVLGGGPSNLIQSLGGGV